MASAVTVTLEGISKAYGDHLVLDGVDPCLDAGTMTAVCGPSGCGKSTLLNIAGLLERPDAGSVCLGGCVAPRPGSRAAMRIVREDINYLFQNFALVESETVAQNLLMALRYVRGRKVEKLGRVRDALDRVGMGSFFGATVCELSGGEQQRVALARVLVKPGQVVLADEPTGSLDVANRDLVVGLLADLAREGRTVLVVTHDAAVAAACDRVVWLG